MGCGRSGIPAEPEGNRTGRKVFCVKFQREMPGLDEPPFDNEMGQKIFETVSKEAWKLWVEQMKMIMNEYRLNLSTPGCAAVPDESDGAVLLRRRLSIPARLSAPQEQELNQPLEASRSRGPITRLVLYFDQTRLFERFRREASKQQIPTLNDIRVAGSGTVVAVIVPVTSKTPVGCAGLYSSRARTNRPEAPGLQEKVIVEGVRGR